MPTDSPFGSIESWQRLFQVQGLRFLINDIWTDHYKSLGVLTFVIDDIWTSYLPRTSVLETLEEGQRVLSSADEFEKYQTAFRQYMSDFRTCASSFPYKNLTAENTEEFLTKLAQLFSYYSKTEFFYTDSAYKRFEESKDPELARNLEQMGKIKNEGREFLNENFFGSEASLSKLIAGVAERFTVSERDLQQYSRKEIIQLFAGEKVPSDILAQRNDSFYMLGKGSDLIIKTGSEARMEIEEFIKTESKLNSIKGVIAHKGIVRGKARIFKMGYDTYGTLSERMNAMEKGDVLIAETTSPEFMPACRKAGAIVTDQGGMLSHAAIVSRELNIPCIVGTGNATDILHDGDMVEVDAHKGIVTIIK